MREKLCHKTTLTELFEMFNDGSQLQDEMNICVSGFLSNIKISKTRRGDTSVSANLKDGVNTVEVFFFPEVLEFPEKSDDLKVQLYGRVNLKEENLLIWVDNVRKNPSEKFVINSYHQLQTIQ